MKARIISGVEPASWKQFDLKKYTERIVRLTLTSGEVLEGQLVDHTDVEAGPYHVEPVPTQSGIIVGGYLPDVTEENVRSIEDRGPGPPSAEMKLKPARLSCRA